MTDTGWQAGAYDTGYLRRRIGQHTMTATKNRWFVHWVSNSGGNPIRLCNGTATNRPEAQRAAEDALRAICRDVLAALGET